MAKGRFAHRLSAGDQASQRRRINEALVPPNPKEFESTVSIVRRLAWCGTRSIAVATEGLSRLSVGGARLSRMARAEKFPPTAPAAPSRLPIGDFGEDIETLPAALPNRLSAAASSISSPIGVEVSCALILSISAG